MNYEIERKFLIKGNYKKEVLKTQHIVQGYLSSVTSRVVRIRIQDERAILCIKSIIPDSEFSRYEWEREIPLSDAKTMLKFCEPGVIEKERHIIPVGKHTFEVDEFHGENEGLVLAEVELESENEAFEKPSWLGEEVTYDKRYYNANLAKHPFKDW